MMFLRLYDDPDTLQIDDVDNNVVIADDSAELTGDNTDSDSITSDPVIVDVQFPDDYISKDVFNSGIQQILDAVSPEVEEDEIVLRGVNNRVSSDWPDTAVYLRYNDQTILFPSRYADDLYLRDNELYNTGDSVTVGFNLDSSTSVSNYVISEVTIPTYNSSAYWQYLNVYGRPYRIVDRYINYNNNYTSSTRSSSTALDFSDSILSDYRGFNNQSFIYIGLLLVLAVTAILGRFRRL